MRGDAVHRRPHPVLTHPEADVAAGEVSRLDVALVLGLGVVGRGQIGRAADQFRDRRHQRIEHIARGLPRRELCVLAAKILAERRDHLVEMGRQFAFLAAQELAAALRRQ